MQDTCTMVSKWRISLFMGYNLHMSVKPWDMLNPNEKRSEQEEIDRRLAICQTCEFFIQKTERCRKCGCFMKLKTKLEKANCPINKW